MSWLNQLVEQYRSDKDLTDIFGVILYTDAHANIIKVLSDDDYWSSFHEVSGDKWVIFSIRPKKGHYDYPEMKPGTLGLMRMIWKEPNENKPLLKEFGIKDTEKLPLLLVFTHDANGNILQQRIKIKDSSIDDAYNSIKEAITVITDAVEGINMENTKNPEGVYQAVNMAVSSYNEWRFIKNGLDFYTWIKRIMP